VGIFRSEKIDRWAIHRMHWKRAINPTQVRPKLVQVGTVQLGKRTHFGLITVDGNPAPPDFGFHVIGDAMSAETLIFDREPAKRTEQILIYIRDIKTINDIKILTYKFMKLIWA
jgi:hypothetical protein